MTAVGSKSRYEQTRLIAHPGPMAPNRLEVAFTYNASSARATLGVGQSLLHGLKQLIDCVAREKNTSAVFTLLKGNFAPCIFCLAARDETGHTVATYTPWTRVRTVEVLGGSATFGCSVDGQPMVHCHAWFKCLDDGEIRGGHLDPTATLVGAGGLVVKATQLAEISVRQTPDPETNHSVFVPLSAGI